MVFDNVFFVVILIMLFYCFVFFFVFLEEIFMNIVGEIKKEKEVSDYDSCEE